MAPYQYISRREYFPIQPYARLRIRPEAPSFVEGHACLNSAPAHKWRRSNMDPVSLLAEDIRCACLRIPQAGDLIEANNGRLWDLT